MIQQRHPPNAMIPVPSLGNLSARTTFKVIVLGDKCVGKSTLINALLDEDGTESSRSFAMGSVSSDVVHYELETEEYGTVRLNVWDTVGEDYTEIIANNIFRGANGVILVYDIANRESFDRIKSRWLPRIRSVLGEGGLGDDDDYDTIMNRDNIFKILVVANKIDIIGDKRAVSIKEAKELTDSLQLPFIQLSTFSDKHEAIKLPFILLISRLMPFFATPNTARPMHIGVSTYKDDSTTCC